MKICFPVETARGLDSAVFGHFGSAPFFLIVDTESGELMEVGNGDQHHTHGKCSPLKALGGQKIDSVVVGGIGGGAFNKLNQLGVAVYRAEGGTVGENLEKVKTGSLQAFRPLSLCSGHGAEGGCAHH